MFTYAGYLRETDEFPVDGDVWSNPCGVDPCAIGDTTLNDDGSLTGQRPSNSRRIDMAAVINDYSAALAPLPKDLEATDGDLGTLRTREAWSENDSDETKSENPEGTQRVCCVWYCTPCMCKIWTIILTVLVLFAIGLGVGLALRNKPSGQGSLAASMGAGSQTHSTGGRSGSKETQNPTLSPTTSPTTSFEWNVNYSNWLRDDSQGTNNGGQTSETNPPTNGSTNNRSTSSSQTNGTSTSNGSTSSSQTNGATTTNGSTSGSQTNGASTSNGSVGSNQTNGASTNNENSTSPYLVGVYYYPWYGEYILAGIVNHLCLQYRSTSISNVSNEKHRKELPQGCRISSGIP